MEERMVIIIVIIVCILWCLVGLVGCIFWWTKDGEDGPETYSYDPGIAP